MMTLNALIVDDEEYSRKSLYFLLQENCHEVQVGGIAKSVTEARELIVKQKFDIIFLDIAMPRENGFELLPHIKDKATAVIFTTAYDEYALKALKANAVDYLLKPIDINELKIAVGKVIERNNMLINRVTEGHHAIQESSSQEKEQKKQTKITLPNTSGFNVIDTSDILFVEADSNYSEFHLNNGSKIVISKPLKEIEDVLNQHEFLRIHKSLIVNFQYIKSYSNKNGWQIFLHNGITLPVSRRRATEFQEKARSYFNH